MQSVVALFQSTPKAKIKPSCLPAFLPSCLPAFLPSSLKNSSFYSVFDYATLRPSHFGFA
jgi:hypothetical protein